MLCPPPAGTIGIWTRSIWNIPHLAAFLDSPVRFRPPLPSQRKLSSVSALAGWGLTSKAGKIRALAADRNLPYLALDEGFLRFIGAGGTSIPPCSLVADSTGLYYDAHGPSDLENLLRRSGWETPALLADARQAMDTIRRYRLSKYNDAPDAPPYHLTTPGKRLRVLLIDQPINDPTVAASLANEESFRRMLEAAHDEHPGAALFLKPHPMTLAGGKHGFLSSMSRSHGVTVLDQPFSSLSLLEQADVVYTVSSHMGFEALMLGKNVRCFGLPFYAGWGLTEDERTCLRRAQRVVKQRTVVELFAAAYLLYARYVNPITGQPCSLQDSIRLLVRQRYHNERNSGYTACVGFSWTQRVQARPFFFSTHGHMEFFPSPTGKPSASSLGTPSGQSEALRVPQVAAQHAARLSAGAARVIVRESLPPDVSLMSSLEKQCAERRIPLMCVHDDILRGLGLTPADRPPLGLLRENAAYRPNDTFKDKASAHLEALLQSMPSVMGRDPALAERAKAVRHRMVQFFQRTGQNVVHPELQKTLDALPAMAHKHKIILVPGEALPHPNASRSQSDAMVALLQSLRAAYPSAYIIHTSNQLAQPPHSPHSYDPAENIANVVLHATPKINAARLDMALFSHLHAVHTLESLSGFAALISGLPVRTHGHPFYAGWGLTTDTQLFPLRTQPLSLDTLVAGVLILHPTWFDWKTGLVCGPEEILHRLETGQLYPRRGSILYRLAREAAARIVDLGE